MFHGLCHERSRRSCQNHDIQPTNDPCSLQSALPTPLSLCVPNLASCCEIRCLPSPYSICVRVLGCSRCMAEYFFQPRILILQFSDHLSNTRVETQKTPAKTPQYLGGLWASFGIINPLGLGGEICYNAHPHPNMLQIPMDFSL